jgi:hypothetical protein
MTYNRELCYLYNNKIKPYQWNAQLKEASKEMYIGNSITGFVIDDFDNVELLLVDFSTIKISSKGTTQVNYAPNTRSKEAKVIFRSKLLNKVVFNSKHKLSHFPNNRKVILNTLNFDKIHILRINDEIFVGSKYGLSQLNTNSFSITKTILTNYSITGITYDFEGGLWCTSLSQGVIYIPNPNIETFNTLLGKNDQFYGIIPQEGNIIFAYGKVANFYEFNRMSNSLTEFHKNLSIFEIDNNQLNKGLKLENPIYIFGSISTIQTICRLDENRILTYNPHYALVCHIKTQPSTPFNELSFFPKVDVHIDKFNNSWKNNRQLNTFQMSTNPQIINRGLKRFKQKTLKIFKDSQGQVWLGTLSGLYTFNTNTEEVENVNHSHKFTQYRIQDIIESKDGTMFFATKAYGIFTLKDSVVTEINTSNGLLSNTINQLIYDSTTNQVWAGTNQGIANLTLQNGAWTPKAIISKYDGLELTDVRQLAFYNDELFFANNTGVSKIKKSELNHSIPPPMLYFKSLKSNLVNQLVSEPIILTHDSNNIQVDYQAISFKSLNHFQYQYKLLPENDKWQSTSNPNLIFNSLAPNHYTLELKAINVDGSESEVKTIQFTIIPAFWMTTWFKSILFLLFFYIVYRIVTSSINFYKKQAENQRTLNELQILSLQSKMNPHFIFNSLNSIQNYILKNEKEEANNYLLEFSKLVRIILQNSNSPTITLGNELDTLNMYVNLEIRRLRNSFKYTTRIDNDIDINLCEIPSLLIQPYVENAIWHGKVYNNPEGEISINIKKIDDLLTFEIIDNGIGIANAQKSKVIKSNHTSLGTSVNEKRIEILGDLNKQLSKVKIKVAFPDKAPNDYVGTHVSFSIPYVTSNEKTNE